MSISLPNKLILGGSLLSLVQVVAPFQLAAQTPTFASTQAAATVPKVATLLIAQQSPAPRRIRFAQGANSAVVENSVVRGTRDTYLLNARKGQKMTLSITSVENNAVFDIIAPNGRTIKQEATSWSSTLPLTGDYQVIVGGTRGNASYQLRTEIK